MQFLIDGDLPRSTGDLVRKYGHEALVLELPGKLAIVEPGRIRIRKG